MHRVRWLVLLAGVVAGVGCVSPAAAVQPPGTCGPSGLGVQTLARSSTARIYTRAGRVLGCASRGSRRSIVLGHTGSCIGQDRVGPVALSGVMAAFASERCGIDTGTTRVFVRRLDAGGLVASAVAATIPGPESYTTVTALRVDSSGLVAWIAEAHSLGSGRRETEVRAIDGSGPRLLDSGAAIGLRSLRLARRVVSWRDGSRRRSAQLAVGMRLPSQRLAQL